MLTLKYISVGITILLLVACTSSPVIYVNDNANATMTALIDDRSECQQEASSFNSQCRNDLWSACLANRGWLREDTADISLRSSFIVPVDRVITCPTNYSYPDAISAFKTLSPTVQLGDSKVGALEVLGPTQLIVEPAGRRLSESYTENGKRIDIYYFRSNWVSDNLSTDDEFTPYIFTDNVLTAIGWRTIGGIQSRAQPQQRSTQSRPAEQSRPFLTGESPPRTPGRLKSCIYSDGSVIRRSAGNSCPRTI
jgi:hypothetical protein